MEEKNLQKDIHIENIRALMRCREMASKSEMTRETGLSFPTVTRIVDALCEDGELVELGRGESTGGRPSAFYGRNTRYTLFLLIRIEGKEISWSVRDLAEQAVEDGKILTESGLVETLDALILQTEEKYPAVKAISIGIAAMVADGMVVESYASAEMKGVDLLKHFRNLTDTPVQVHNDMNLIALGGWHRSKIKPSSSVALYLGKPCMGAGIVVGGEVWPGVTNFAGELGFLPIQQPDGLDTDMQADAETVMEYYTALIRIYASVLNPQRVVLYENSIIKGNIDEIRRRCAGYLPEKGMPEIEVSDAYETDYEKGLYAAAGKIMEG